MDNERKVMNKKEQSELLSVTTHYKRDNGIFDPYESVKFTDSSVDFSEPIEDEELISRVEAENKERFRKEQERRASEEQELRRAAAKQAAEEDVVPNGILYNSSFLIILSLIFIAIIVLETYLAGILF